MKKISALLIAFIMLIQMLVIMPSAAGSNEITITGGDCYTQSIKLERDTREGRNWVRIDSNQWVGYKVNFEKPTSVLKLDYHTGATSRHILEVRLGSASGKLIGSFDTRLEATVEWGIFQHIFTFDEPLVGQQSIFIKGLGGNNWVCGLTFVADGDQVFDSYEENDNFNDIKNDKNRSKINLLSDLDIIPKTEKSFMPSYPVTRQEFVSMLGKVINADKYSMSESPFGDVKITDENARLITGLYQLGIIKGDTEGNFRPHSFITTLEAATVCINALGYKPFAKGMIDAFELADKLNIFKDVDLSKKEITYSDAAAIMYNLLLCDYLKVSEYSDDTVAYEPTKNYLEQNSEYKHGTGVVTSNKVTELFAAKKSSRITIDGEYFETGEVKGSYLGMLCDYFYTEDGGIKTLKAIRPAKKNRGNGCTF